MEFRKFTTRYDKRQDRLCLDGQFAGGEVVSLWLTYRLLLRLIPLLIKLITPKADTDDKAASLAEWALTAARAQQKSEEAVTWQSYSFSSGDEVPLPASWLISAIDLKSSPQCAVLVFRISANKAVARITFTPEHLRQWLSIVYRLWQGAGWPTNDWPAWLKENETAPSPVVLH